MFDGTTKCRRWQKPVVTHFRSAPAFGVKWNFYEQQTMTEIFPCWFHFPSAMCQEQQEDEQSHDRHTLRSFSFNMHEEPVKCSTKQISMPHSKTWLNAVWHFSSHFVLYFIVCDNKQKLLTHSFASRKYGCKSFETFLLRFLFSPFRCFTKFVLLLLLLQSTKARSELAEENLLFKLHWKCLIEVSAE